MRGIRLREWAAAALALALGAGCGERARSMERETPAMGTPSAAGIAGVATPPTVPAPRRMAAGTHGTDPDAEPVSRVGVGNTAGAGGAPMTPAEPAPEEMPVTQPTAAQRPAQVVCRRRSQLSGFRSDGTIGSVYLGAYWDGHAFVATDRAGNIVVVASFLGAIDLGGGMLSANDADWGLFVAKYDAECRHVWSRTFGTPAARVEGGPIAIDARGEIVLGGSLVGSVDFGNGVLRAREGQVNGWVAKLRADGTARFSEVFAGDLSYVRSISIDGDGNAILAGTGSADTSLGGAELGEHGTFVAKLAPDGSHLWSRRLPSAIDGAAVRASASGALTLAGFTQHTLSWGDGSEPLAANGWLFFMSQLDPQGTHRWSAELANEDVSWGYRVAFDSADVAFATFGTLPDAAMRTQRVLERIDASGQRLSIVRWEGPGLQASHAWDLAADPAGRILELGTFTEPLALGDRQLIPAGGHDVYLVRRDPTGRVLWAVQQGSERFNHPLGVAAAFSGHAVVAWYTVDPQSLEADEIEIVKFAP